MRTAIAGWMVLVGSVLPAFASADVIDANLLQQRAYDPITALFGLPAAAARLTTPNELQVSLAHSNVFMGGTEGGETLILDGETSQLSLRYHQRLDSCWQASAEAAWLAHSAGWFDRVIDDWHQWFGLPDAERDVSPYFNLNYIYADGNGSQRSVTAASTGAGDVQLSLQRYLGCDPQSAIARVGVKLPVGELDSFLGSGNTDWYSDLQLPYKRIGNWGYTTSLGILNPGEVDGLGKQRSLVGFGTLGLQYQWQSGIAGLLQLDWHTALFDSELRELGAVAAQVSFGIRLVTLGGHSLEVTMAEDAVIDTSPDIVLRVAWTQRFSVAGSR